MKAALALLTAVSMALPARADWCDRALGRSIRPASTTEGRDNASSPRPARSAWARVRSAVTAVDLGLAALAGTIAYVAPDHGRPAVIGLALVIAWRVLTRWRAGRPGDETRGQSAPGPQPGGFTMTTVDIHTARAAPAVVTGDSFDTPAPLVIAPRPNDPIATPTGAPLATRTNQMFDSGADEPTIEARAPGPPAAVPPLHVRVWTTAVGATAVALTLATNVLASPVLTGTPPVAAPPKMGDVIVDADFDVVFDGRLRIEKNDHADEPARARTLVLIPRDPNAPRPPALQRANPVMREEPRDGECSNVDLPRPGLHTDLHLYAFRPNHGSRGAANAIIVMTMLDHEPRAIARSTPDGWTLRSRAELIDAESGRARASGVGRALARAAGDLDLIIDAEFEVVNDRVLDRASRPLLTRASADVLESSPRPADAGVEGESRRPALPGRGEPTDLAHDFGGWLAQLVETRASTSATPPASKPLTDQRRFEPAGAAIRKFDEGDEFKPAAHRALTYADATPDLIIDADFELVNLRAIGLTPRSRLAHLSTRARLSAPLTIDAERGNVSTDGAWLARGDDSDEGNQPTPAVPKLLTDRRPIMVARPAIPTQVLATLNSYGEIHSNPPSVLAEAEMSGGSPERAESAPATSATEVRSIDAALVTPPVRSRALPRAATAALAAVFGTLVFGSPPEVIAPPPAGLAAPAAPALPRAAPAAIVAAVTAVVRPVGVAAAGEEHAPPRNEEKMPESDGANGSAAHASGKSNEPPIGRNEEPADAVSRGESSSEPSLANQHAAAAGERNSESTGPASPTSASLPAELPPRDTVRAPPPVTATGAAPRAGADATARTSPGAAVPIRFGFTPAANWDSFKAEPGPVPDARGIKIPPTLFAYDEAGAPPTPPAAWAASAPPVAPETVRADVVFSREVSAWLAEVVKSGDVLAEMIGHGVTPGTRPGIKPRRVRSPFYAGPIYAVRLGPKTRAGLIRVGETWQVLFVSAREAFDARARRLRALAD